MPAGVAGFNLVNLALTDKASLESWVARLDGLGVDHSPIIDATIGGSWSSTTPTASNSTPTGSSATGWTKRDEPATADPSRERIPHGAAP